MSNYITVKVGKIITRIAKKTSLNGYTEGIIEVFLPTDEELKKMSTNAVNNWINKNNTRMEGICKFLNESNL